MRVRTCVQERERERERERNRERERVRFLLRILPFLRCSVCVCMCVRVCVCRSKGEKACICNCVCVDVSSCPNRSAIYARPYTLYIFYIRFLKEPCRERAFFNKDDGGTKESSLGERGKKPLYWS